MLTLHRDLLQNNLINNYITCSHTHTTRLARCSQTNSNNKCHGTLHLSDDSILATCMARI